MAEHPQYTNHLIKEKSLYLQQHAHNPVNWYPWGEEALNAAKLEDKPIFLSIGYATCHWCHVMEHESFENQEIATLLNETFINIKVDREEQPELDSLYIEFAQTMMAGAAGWPLNIILTPDLQPFFAATYLPPHASHGLTGMVDLVPSIREVWNSDERDHLIEQAQQIVLSFAENVIVEGENIPDKEQISGVADVLFKLSDPTYGGFKGTPKFPIGYQWNFLLHYASMYDDGRSLFLAERTLDMMQRGGIYDHLGGGFSRYSIDEKWLVPHFEKMLYDNALLAYSYLEAWQIRKTPFYQTTCEDILNYVLRDMTHPDGGFYSAEDADSEGHEGYFYTWTYQEVKDLLAEKDSDLFCEYYGITKDGNFENRNILNTPLRLNEFASKKELAPEELKKQFDLQKNILWKEREKRIHPLKDDKILSSWNGLMICSMAEAGAAFNNTKYMLAAKQAAQFIKKNMWVNGRLNRRWREGEALFDAGLDEYAFLIKGLLSLFEIGEGTEWLSWAIEMTAILNDEFKAEQGAFYQTNGHDKNIIVRKCQLSDGAEPSGNAIQCENLLKLYQLTKEKKYLRQAEDIFKVLEVALANFMPGYYYHMINLMRYYNDQATTAIIALNKKESNKEEIRQLLFQQFLPNRAVIWSTLEDEQLRDIIPFMRQQRPIKEKTTLYLCDKDSCQEPLTELPDMISSVQSCALS